MTDLINICLIIVVWVGIPVMAIYSFIAFILDCIHAKKEGRKLNGKVLARFIIFTSIFLLFLGAFAAFVYVFSGR